MGGLWFSNDCPDVNPSESIVLNYMGKCADRARLKTDVSYLYLLLIQTVSVRSYNLYAFHPLWSDNGYLLITYVIQLSERPCCLQNSRRFDIGISSPEGDIIIYDLAELWVGLPAVFFSVIVRFAPFFRARSDTSSGVPGCGLPFNAADIALPTDGSLFFPVLVTPVSYTHLTLPTNREV